MTNHRIITTLAVVAAALASGVPASYGDQAPLSAAVHLEAHANAHTDAAQRVMSTSRLRAQKLMARGARELARAATIVNRSSDDKEAVLDAQASLSSSAADQSATLTAIARTASGKLEAAARRARVKVEAIRSDADAVLVSAGSSPDVVSVSASADVSSGDADDDAEATSGIQLLGVLGGGDE
jgi:hypothetical protein